RQDSFSSELNSFRAAALFCLSLQVTESFLSKEVSYVVSSNKEAKRGKARTRTEKWSNATSGDAKATSSMPSTSKGTHARPHQKPPDTALISRGKELLQKAMKNQVSSARTGFSLTGSILANARLWGVRIVHVDGILLCGLTARPWHLVLFGDSALSRCDALSNPAVPAWTLTPCSAACRQFRPFHHQFKSFPDLNFQTPKSSSPFEPLKNLSNSCRASDGEKSPRSTLITVRKKKRGFCECCQETFEELQKHLQSPQHKRFALDDSHYAPVDRVIAQLAHDF
ncbi:DBF4B protein, partial [Trogon melanurus]|nr:DBF4B protein [Trogon melanurus]